MSPFVSPEHMSSFFAGLREKDFHLGLDPEFTAIQILALAPPDQRWPALRENIDRFFWGRGFPVLERLLNKAAEIKDTGAAQVLGSMGQVISEFLRGQFIAVPDGVNLPQPAMLREMLRLFNTYDSDAILTYIDQNLAALDGHFFMSLSESQRNARGRGEQPTYQVLVMLGKFVAEKRKAKGMPCTFAVLYGV